VFDNGVEIKKGIGIAFRQPNASRKGNCDGGFITFKKGLANIFYRKRDFPMQPPEAVRGLLSGDSGRP